MLWPGIKSKHGVQIQGMAGLKPFFRVYELEMFRLTNHGRTEDANQCGLIEILPVCEHEYFRFPGHDQDSDLRFSN